MRTEGAEHRVILDRARLLLHPRRPMAAVTLAKLRAFAVTRSLFSPTDLLTAIRRLGFVQADPIRSPARAQDLILRHRVAGYHAGDLEAAYPTLPLVEELLHTYGFLPVESLSLLHPRSKSRLFQVETKHPHLRRAILSHLKRHGVGHPRDIDRLLGGVSVVNAWGGSSAATTRMLEALHYEGSLRVTRRDAGIKIYALAEKRGRALSSVTRAKKLVVLLTGLYAPLSIQSLRRILAWLSERAPSTHPPRTQIEPMLLTGELASARIGETTYVWPAGESLDDAVPDEVRFLAPFDPVVWDRARFAQLWGWEYRFEAYTPAPKRQFGYYALPLLWRDVVLGWANVTASGGAVDIALGFIGKRPRDLAFKVALERESERMRMFLL